MRDDELFVEAADEAILVVEEGAELLGEAEAEAKFELVVAGAAYMTVEAVEAASVAEPVAKTWQSALVASKTSHVAAFGASANSAQLRSCRLESMQHRSVLVSMQ